MLAYFSWNCVAICTFSFLVLIFFVVVEKKRKKIYFHVTYGITFCYLKCIRKLSASILWITCYHSLLSQIRDHKIHIIFLNVLTITTYTDPRQCLLNILYEIFSPFNIERQALEKCYSKIRSEE